MPGISVPRIAIPFKGKGGINYAAYWKPLSVQFFDGTIAGGELVDMSPLALNAKYTHNAVRNSDCEGNYGYFSHNGGTIEQSVTQKHGGSYSFKCTVTGGANKGIKTSSFNLLSGHNYTYGFWIYIQSLTGVYGNLRASLFENGTARATQLMNVTTGEWKFITGSYDITVTGADNQIIFYVTGGDAVCYFDDFSLIDNTEVHNYIELQKDSDISDHDTLNVFYDTSANPKRLDVTTLATCSNDKVFTNDDANKYLILTQQTNARQKSQTLDWLGGTYTITDYFTTARTIKGYVVDEHYAFNGFANVGGRLYCFLRKGLSHNVLGSTTYMTYSDDGITWTDIVEVYTGAHVMTDHPEILVADPAAVIDVRDSRCLVLANGNLLVFTTIVAGHMDGDLRDEAARYTMCLQIPVTGKVADWESMAISYIPAVVANPAFSGGCKEIGGSIYATTYEGENVYMHKSSDGGSTWTTISTVFSAANYFANENDFEIVSGVMYVFGRSQGGGQDAKSCVAKSVDNGVTWTDHAEVNTSVHYPHLVAMNDGKTLVYGRNNYTGYGSRDITIHKMNGLAISGDIKSFVETVTQDVGYGQMVYKEGVYYFSYHDGPASETYTGFADAGVYYKAIYGKIQDY